MLEDKFKSTFPLANHFSVFAQKIEQKEQEQAKAKPVQPQKSNDTAYIQEVLAKSPALKDASHVVGQPFVVMAYLKGFHLQITQGQAVKEYVVFTFPQLNGAVLEFFLHAAKKDTIKGIVANTEHAVLASDYK